ncbi:MAG: hypothetical protein JWQ01_1314 [Massilia sp.]|nr:hypothetical protein [Massilia sp.]
MVWIPAFAGTGAADFQQGPASQRDTHAGPLIVSMAHVLKPLRLAPGIEAIVLVVLTLTSSFAVVEVVRRCAPLRPLFGLGKAPEQAPVQDTRRLAAA